MGFKQFQNRLLDQSCRECQAKPEWDWWFCPVGGIGERAAGVWDWKAAARGMEAHKLVAMHRRWIALNWGCEPQDEAYLGLANGYLADQRFVDYYDKPCGTGATAFLVQAIESSLTRA